MGMYSVLGSALSGLRATQAGLDLVARNVANADTPGYTKKTLGQSAIVSGDMVAGVRLGDVTRQLDTMVQRQLRMEMSGAGYVRTLSRYYEHLDMLFGQPGSPAALDTLFNEFRGSLETLSASPDSFTARDQLLRDAQSLAQMLNQTSGDIQTMRLEAEKGIGNAVQRVNELLVQISKLNQEIASRPANSPPADLLDLRDGYVTELSTLVDVKVIERDRGSIALFTQSGALLLDLEPAELIFDERGTMTPESLYSTNDAERNVGTIRLRSSNGMVIDLIQDKSIRSGELAALIEMRDTHLVNAQAQLDAMAASMASALSARGVQGEAVNDGIGSFDLDVPDMLSGDRISLTYNDGTQDRRLTLIRVGDPNTLPLSDDATADPNDVVIGFHGASLADALDAALGGAFDVQDNGDGALRFTPASANTIATLSASLTATGFDEGMGLPFFIDAGGGGIPYSGSLDGIAQQTGFASRIKLNPALLADNSRLVLHSSAAHVGDPARPMEMLRRLTEDKQFYSGSLGIGGQAAYSGTVSGFVQRIIAHQGAQAADVSRARVAQDVIVAQLEERFSAHSGVNIDEEMARLIELQTAYQANTRVVQAWREMMTLLLQL